VPSAGTAFLQDSAHISAWVNSVANDGASPAPVVSLNPNTNGLSIYPRFNADSKSYFRVNDSFESAGFVSGHYNNSGFWLGNRSSSTLRQGYLDADASAFSYPTVASSARSSNHLVYLYDGAGSFSTAQIAAMTIGGSLTATQAAALQKALKTYLTPLYVFYCFQPAGTAHNLYALKSSDLNSWTPFAAMVVPPTGRTVRDPSVRAIGGIYVAAYTAPLASNEFGTLSDFPVATSPDGLRFTNVATIDCSSITGTGANARAWGPTWFIDDDGSPHIIIALSSDGAATFAHYETHPTSSDFSTWSTLAAISGLPNAIDGFLVSPANSPSGKYSMWYADCTAGIGANERVCYATSTSLLGPYTAQNTGDWAGWGTILDAGVSVGFEGPSLYKMDNGSWRIILDNEGRGIWTSDSSDGWATWSTRAAFVAPAVSAGSSGGPALQNGEVARTP
jgi:hypothetical protein